MTRLKLLRSSEEIGNIRTFAFETNDISWIPGQYQKYKLEQVEGDDAAKKRYFTLASAPSDNEIHITTRVTDSGFKKALSALKPGDEIEAEGVKGDFTWDDDKGVVLVAGGIGVTPYHSMLVERANHGNKIPAHLLYFGRDDNFAFADIFDEIVKRHPELTIDYIIGEHISAETILSHAPEAKEMTVYISGSEPMVDTVGEDLKAKGIPIKQDWFPGYTDQTY